MTASLSMPELAENSDSFLTTNMLKFLMFYAVNTSPEVPWPILLPSLHLISEP